MGVTRRPGRCKRQEREWALVMAGMIDEIGQTLIIVQLLIIFVCSTLTCIPLIINAWRWHWTGRLSVLRLAGATYSSGLALVCGWNLLLWLDFRFANRQVFGPATQRWSMDNLMLMPLTIGVTLFFWSYREVLRGYARKRPSTKAVAFDDSGPTQVDGDTDRDT